MTRGFTSLQKRTIQEVLEWYEFLVEVLGREKTRVLAELNGNILASDSRFFGMTADEVGQFFERHRNELDLVAMLDLLAAAEAAVRLDYRARVRQRLKDPVSRRLRDVEKRLRRRHRREAGLEEDILNTWMQCRPRINRPASDFKGVLKLRHWLAHGRYWDPKMGRPQYSPRDVYDISLNLIEAISA